MIDWISVYYIRNSFRGYRQKIIYEQVPDTKKREKLFDLINN